MQIGSSPLSNGAKLLRRKSAVLMLTLLFFVVTALVTTWFSTAVISFSAVQKNFRPSDIWIVDQHGQPMESIRSGNQKRSLDWIKWAEVSNSFQTILIETEDKRFYSHSGVDLLALANAIKGGIAGSPFRGASTITMQLVGLLDGENLNGRRTVGRKLIQLFRALKLDSKWTKQEILEAYINLASFRGELIGLRAVSTGYFAKNPVGLMNDEAALLIALLRSPNSQPDRVGTRACKILNLTDCAPLISLAQKIFSKPYQLSRSRELVPVLSKYFVQQSGNTSIVQTTLDYRIQDHVLKILREHLRNLKAQNVNDGAVLVLETKTGQVLAYAANGGSGFTSAEQIDGIQSLRQAGSTIKPFVYATAFDWNLLKPNSLLLDSVADISISQGRVYHPKNYDLVFRGLVSAGDALGSSLNVPAVRALQLVGEAKVLDKLHLLGFNRLEHDDYYGPSLALGAIDTTLWELTQGYRQFATANSTFSEKTKADIFNILASPEYRRFTFGMDSVLTLPFAAAVKTGTSKDMRDNWAIGWTNQFTVGVWVGNFNGEPMWNVSGVSGAAPVWRSLMLALHPNPETKITNYIEPATALPVRTISHIRYPAADMLVGFDPDIPKRLQKLPIEIENPQLGHRVFLNKRLLSKAQETMMWPIQRGKYKLELKSEMNAVVDAVNFEVR